MNPQQQLIERIKQAQNVLVTVSANPTVDQLAAAIGLALVLNKLGKHGTAVFSGAVPSTIEFLKPDKTLEKNTDSLRDFIIALDKNKADKLRYKVENEVVRIFITPYKTSISEKDLQFSQGDFNVDVVICLGVTQQQDLDSAIIAHGRILHDATVASVNAGEQAGNGLGSINWNDPKASGLSEMVVSLVDGLDKKTLDNQIATALLTGVVASTERFRNDRTTPNTMSVSAELMAAGANPQLIATELEPKPQPAPTPAPEIPPAAPQAPDMQALTPPPPGTDVQPVNPPPAELVEPPAEPGTLQIDHGEDTPAETPEAETPPEPEEPPQPQIDVNDDGKLITLGDETAEPQAADAPAAPEPKPEPPLPPHELISTPPQIGQVNVTPSDSPDDIDADTEELHLPPVNTPLLTHNETVLPPAAQGSAPQPPAQPGEAPTAPVVDNQGSSLNEARNAVEAALSQPGAPDSSANPLGGLDAAPLADSSVHTPLAGPSNPGFSEPTPGNSPADETLDMPLPPAASQPALSPTAPDSQPSSGGVPPVPPPFIPPPQQ